MRGYVYHLCEVLSKCELVIQHLLNPAVMVLARELCHFNQEVLKRNCEAGMASDFTSCCSDGESS